jgi:ribosomal protein S18 acetylase RimI-like enzyme
MTHIDRLERLDSGVELVLRDLALRLGQVYGPSAEAAYAEIAPRRLPDMLASPNTAAFAARCQGETAGIVLTIRREDAIYVSVLHLRQAFEGMGWERLLLEAAVADAREEGADVIISDCQPVCRVELDEWADEAGFRRARRVLMKASAADAPAPDRNASDADHSLPFQPRNAELDDVWDCAGTIAAAYDHHPHQWLHPETATEEQARRYLMECLAESLGVFRPGYLQCAGARPVAGLALGAEPFPRVGCVLQVAVRPEQRRKGLAAALVAALVRRFGAEGVRDAFLTVTEGNPARRIYERLGFAEVMTNSAYAWRRGGPASAEN